MSRIVSRLSVCVLAALILAPLSALAQQQGVFLDLVASHVFPSGTAFVRTADGITANTAASYESDNHLDIPSFRYYGNRYRLEVAYRQSTFTGGSFLQGSTSRSTSTRYWGDLGVDHFSLGFRADVVERPIFSLGLGADIDRFRLESTLFGPNDAELRSTRTHAAPVATLGFNLHDRARRAFLDLKLGYSNLSSVEVSKARAEAGYAMWDHAGVKAAWEGLRYRETSRETDLKLGTVSGGFFFRF